MVFGLFAREEPRVGPAPRLSNEEELKSRIELLVENGGQPQLLDDELIPDQRPEHEIMVQLTDMLLDLYCRTTSKEVGEGYYRVSPREYVENTGIRKWAANKLVELAKEYASRRDDAKFDYEDFTDLHQTYFGGKNLSDLGQDLAQKTVARIQDSAFWAKFYNNEIKRIRDGKEAIESSFLRPY